MSDAVLISLISAGASVMASIIGLMNNALGRKNSQHLEAQGQKIEASNKAIQTLEKNTNSIKDELVKVTAESEFAKGLKQGQDQSK